MSLCLNGQIDQIAGDWLIVPVCEQDDWRKPLAALDQATGGLVGRLTNDDFTPKLGVALALRGVSGAAVRRVVLVGLGPEESLTAGAADRALRSAFRGVTDRPDQHVAVWLGTVSPDRQALLAEAAATAAVVGSMGQDLYRTERVRFPLGRLDFAAVDLGEATTKAIEQGTILGESINLTRELVNRSPQEVTPIGFTRRAEQVAAELGLTIQVFDQPRLESERMRSLLAVARGSVEPPRMVVLEYRGGPADQAPLALVGKGVTFDSGGLSLKPTDGMLTMKCDMAGAATVLGAMAAIARLRLPVNVVGLMGLVENMPSGSAFKLGEILTARNGVTIEVLNTDAEGRLVLADVLSYAVDSGVSRIIDLATLTGACVVALGEDVTGAFTNDQEWCNELLAAAKSAGEDVWQLPMFDLYDDLIKGEVGDIKNTGGRWGGAISAAKFLERFVGETPWVHLDIAGPSFASSARAYRDAGATGCMVKTLVEIARRGTPAG